MSATGLAGFVVAAVVAGLLGALAGWLVWRARPGQRARLGLTAAGLGVLALTIVGVAAGLANPPGPPHQEWSSRCQPGTYDNGDYGTDHPHCMPWPASGSHS